MSYKLKQYFVRIMKGEETHPFLEKVLTFFSWIYFLVIQFRNFLYYAKIIKPVWLDSKVISIGNITLGGTGKTPLVIMLAEYFRNRKKKVVILSRGYKRRKRGTRGEGIEKGIGLVSTGKEVLLSPQEAGDEPYLLAKYLSSVPVLVGANRVKTGSYAIENFKPDIIILDDAFSYRRVYKNLEIVAVDCTCPFGNHYLLPHGYLREPLGNLKRAEIIVLTKTNLVSLEELDLITNKIRKINSFAPIIRSVHRAQDLVNLATGESINIGFLKNKEIVSLSSIGSPESFDKTLQDLGASVIKSIRYPDHHYYTREDFIHILEEAEYSLIVTTEKDTTRFKKEFWNLEKIARINFLALRIKIEIIKGEADWLKKLKPLLI